MKPDPDRRVRRTRRALHDALLAMMIEKGYDAVTVQDIIDRADVGRSTFYSHFTDKADLLQQGCDNLRALLDQPGPTGPTNPGRPFRFSLPMFQHAQEQRRLVEALAGRRGGPILEQLERVLAEIVRDELARLTDRRRNPVVPTDATVRFVVGAYLAVLNWWLADPDGYPPERADEVFQTLVAPGVRAALGQG
jgi:AcrR family transcriptional regulator